jgi:hypothetical protein
MFSNSWDIYIIHRFYGSNIRLNNDNLKYLYPTLTLVFKETVDKRKYFESVDTLKFKDKLFVNTDNRNK